MEKLEMKNLFNRFVREDAGQDLIEYALLAGIIAVGAVAIMGTLKTAIVGEFQKVVNALP
jgi:pilus assembly protein Flp/PilA